MPLARGMFFMYKGKIISLMPDFRQFAENSDKGIFHLLAAITADHRSRSDEHKQLWYGD
jgi:hypothetical protein